MAAKSHKALVRSGYLIALMIALLPLMDTLIAVYPFHFSDERWRFGAVGALTGIALLPLLGGWIAVVIAAVEEHFRTRRVLGWIANFLAVLCAVVFFFFLLDYFQARADVRPEYRDQMDHAAMSGLIKQFFTIVTLVFLGIAGLAGEKGPTGFKPLRKKPMDRSETPLISIADRE